MIETGSVRKGQVAACVGVLAVMSVATSACGGHKSSSTTTTTGPVVPGSIARQIRALAGARAYLPAYLPSGYRYASWQPNTALDNGPRTTLFLVTFGKGGQRLVWGVVVERGAATRIPCGASSAGHATTGGQTAYWSLTGTEAQKKYGGKVRKGRNFWTCRIASNGDHLFIVLSSTSEAFDTSTGARMAASASVKAN